MIGRGKTGT